MKIMQKNGWKNIINIKDLDMERFKYFIIDCIIIAFFMCQVIVLVKCNNFDLSKIPSKDPKFESVQEELDSLHSWNAFKIKLNHELTECIDIVEQITYDTFDPDDSIVIDDFIDVLKDRGYYYHLNNIDNLYRDNI